MPANPCGFAYANMSGVPPYAKPGGLLVAGRGPTHWTNAAWQPIRGAGAKVLAYIGYVERPDIPVSSQDTEFYMGDIQKVPLWPYPQYGVRQNWKNTHMTDIRPDQPWERYALNYMRNMMASKKVDGVFLDVLGARTWGTMANWDTFSQTEKDAWTKGCISFVKKLSAIRDQVNSDFIIVNNNVWVRGDSLGLEGEKYVDGVCLEGHAADSPFHTTYIKKPFGENGKRRTTIIISNDAVAWSKLPGVTHVCNQTSYATPSPPPVPFVAPTAPVPVPVDNTVEITLLKEQLATVNDKLRQTSERVQEVEEENSKLITKIAAATRALELGDM